MKSARKAPPPPELKRFRVPVIHLVQVGLEVTVEAENEAEAIKKALKDDTEGYDYDWDRMTVDHVTLGDWDPITEEKD